jgi:hypothetical protein
VKKFWPINKNLPHYAQRFFPTKEKFAHWSKNPDYAIDSYTGLRSYRTRKLTTRQSVYQRHFNVGLSSVNKKIFHLFDQG